MRRSNLDLLFKPESVAVIGASEKEHSIGQALIHNLLKDEFPGKIYPVNRKYQEILGLPAYPVVTAVKAPIDLAIIAIPIRDVPSAMQECGEAGISTAIIISAGGKEVGKPGKEIEAAIKAEAQKAGIRYLGPNCLGVLCPSSKLHASFAPHCAQPGNLAFISQSGALCSSILGWAIPKKIGFSHFISVGSMADLDFGDLIDYLGNEEQAKSIVIYMENLTQHRKFMSAARSVSRIKPIIVIKAGRSRAGAQAAASHTGAMAGADRAYNAAFRRAGIIRVDTIGQLFDCAEALGKVKRPIGGSLGIISNAGAPGVMAVDALGRWDMEPAALSAETLEQLDEFLPPYWSRSNPIDILGDAPPERYLWAVQVAMAAPELAGLVIILSPQAMTDPTGVARALAPEVKGKGRPIFAVWMGGDDVAEGVQILNDAGIPTFETPEQAVDTFMEMWFYTRYLELLQDTPPRLTQELSVNTRQARTFMAQCLSRQGGVLTELESKAILSAYGVPVNPTVAASSAADAVGVAEMLGFPVALKINSPDISHKSEVGGMRFNLQNESEVMRAYEEITSTVRARNPEANILGVTVQTQEREPTCELIIGSKRDPDFGPLILFGAGGVFTEVLDDSAVDLPPLNLLLARRLIEKTKVSRVLEGYRNLPPANLDQLAEILVRISQLVTDFPEIVELDINPLLVINGRFVAVDARVIIEPAEVPAPRHLIIAPYPNQYESDWMLRDGTPVLMRPMKPEDEPLVSEFLGKCSEETIYFRYFKLIKKWTHEMLIRFTQNDYDRELGLMAIGQPPGPEVMMGVSRMVMAADRSTAEFAVIVADPWQGKGLGPKLVERLSEIAREQGVKLLTGDVLAQNQPMLEMVKRLGFSLRKDTEGGTYRVELALQDADRREVEAVTG
ncbi:MAG: bifunctional acetate--CoA ligase family protein/GNAT family N-acetyltransferase [Syntrophobacterales bacterium]|jgi:acetyltransferase|nr:bifunctional acetate--CoA ligase family protein/GNAT family N-acetyltransferase [Syntrophobacterales bacterium]